MAPLARVTPWRDPAGREHAPGSARRSTNERVPAPRGGPCARRTSGEAGIRTATARTRAPIWRPCIRAWGVAIPCPSRPLSKRKLDPAASQVVGRRVPAAFGEPRPAGGAAYDGRAAGVDEPAEGIARTYRTQQLVGSSPSGCISDRRCRAAPFVFMDRRSHLVRQLRRLAVPVRPPRPRRPAESRCSSRQVTAPPRGDGRTQGHPRSRPSGQLS
jgi:hypothetical protein